MYGMPASIADSRASSPHPHATTTFAPRSVRTISPPPRTIARATRSSSPRSAILMVVPSLRRPVDPDPRDLAEAAVRAARGRQPVARARRLAGRRVDVVAARDAREPIERTVRALAGVDGRRPL